MTTPTIAGAAGVLRDARLRRKPVRELPEAVAPGSEAAAYDLQDALHEALAAAGHGTVTGYKIGCTTPVMQAYLGIETPCAGGVFDSTVHRREARLEHGVFVRPGVECEIAVSLAMDLAPRAAPHDRPSVAAAVGTVMAAIEVVDDRWVDHRAVPACSLIADDFFGAGCVLAEPVSDWHGLDLAAVAGEMRVNGETVGTGVGADILGHPLDALAWLADVMGARGVSLREGDVVLLGSLVKTVWVDPGDEVDVRVAGLGRARARFC